MLVCRRVDEGEAFLEHVLVPGSVTVGNTQAQRNPVPERPLDIVGTQQAKRQAKFNWRHAGRDLQTARRGNDPHRVRAERGAHLDILCLILTAVANDGRKVLTGLTTSPNRSSCGKRRTMHPPWWSLNFQERAFSTCHLRTKPLDHQRVGAAPSAMLEFGEQPTEQDNCNQDLGVQGKVLQVLENTQACLNSGHGRSAISVIEHLHERCQESALVAEPGMSGKKTQHSVAICQRGADAKRTPAS